MMKYDKDKAIEAIKEYVYFCEDNIPEPFTSDDSDVRKFDAKRKAKHLAVGAVFGLNENTYPDVKQAIVFGSWSWEWKNWKNLDEYFEWKYWQIIDELSKIKAIHCGIETDYERKPRIDAIIEKLEKQVKIHMKSVDEVMDEYKNNHDAWNKDHHDKNRNEKYLHDNSNRHDYNGVTSTIKKCIAEMKKFAEQPMEAYLKVATKVFIDNNYSTVISCITKLDAIAFRAQMQYKKEPFYKYIEKKRIEEKKNG